MLVLDRKIALIALALGAVAFWNTYAYPREVVAFPRFLLYILFALSVLLFIFPRQRTAEHPVSIIYSKEKLLSFFLLVAYAVIFPFVGYFVTTFVFIVFYLWLFRRKGWGFYFLFAVVYVALMYAVFQKWLYVWFPEGWLF